MENNMQETAVVERVKKDLNDLFNGSGWVTDNFNRKVFSIEASQAFKKVPGNSHSVAELVAHITAWRQFVVQKLTGNADYDIRDESSDWPEARDWNAVISQFGLCHSQLLAALDSFAGDRLNEKVPGRNYSFLYLINGIVQHDYYHYGQIGSVLAAIRQTASGS